MNSARLIEHDGVVEDVSGNMLKVRIRTASACGSCQARQACPAADGPPEKIIDVGYRGTKQFSAGDPVIVILESAQGARAVLAGYVIPFLLVFGALVIGSFLFRSELFAGIAALAVLLPYYAVLYCLRGRMKQMFVFRLKDDGQP